MAAFTGYDPIDAEREASPTGGFDPSNLERLDPRNAPAGPPAASRGALPGAPAQAGAPVGPAFDKQLGVGEARKPENEGKDFYGEWARSSAEDKDAVADSMEQNFAQQGMSLEGAVDMLYKQGGEAAARLGRRFGLVPPEEKAGTPAFKTTEAAVADMEAGEDKLRQKKDDERRSKRRAMGGFLMEMGLRILSSNKADAPGAIAEGALGTIGSRRESEAAAADRKIAMEDRERRQKMEDAAEARAERKMNLDEWKAKKPKLAQITDKDGNVMYVEEQEGYVLDEDGNRVRKASDAELSAAQQETTKRAKQQQINSERRAIQKLVDEDGEFSDNPEIVAIAKEENADKRRKMIAQLARQRVESVGAQGAGDPLNLGL